ncbi:pilus assembly protein CpaF [Schaalia meyeri]|uniref:CpaF family protein n=1 Tax=Schaalia meyeri TaxID=52773 RepID=UPI0006800735|nr:ATPase, T2SS/T4P/T4SS family [Schaalia meyeri]AKU64599.1 pilus assembly protein CpaF [Schaalia meyeri]OFQ24796.1 pilus assembly protein CpaF [Actinomyces sp. HMSC062G12]
MEAVTRALAAQVREGLAMGGIDATRNPRSVRALIERAIDQHASDLLPSARERVEADLMDDICGLGPLQVLMDDPGVEEIWINSASRVFVARSGIAELTSLILTDEDVRALVERMLHHSGRRLDLSSPFVDAMLAGGERLHVVIPPVTGSSWSVNIRKHIQRARTLEDLVTADMIAPPMRDFLAAAVCCGLSVLVSGGTQAGKTTLLRALAGELPRSRRVISCEEVFELGLANWDHVAMQTRPAGAEGTGEVTLRDLVRESLRMRPEYLIVGEVRGPEALDLLVALNAGVPGMATVHANSAREALDKLSILPLLAGENVTTGFVTPTLASSIDLVCHVERGAGGHRYLSEILAVPGRVEGNRIETATLFTFDGERCERASGGLDMHERFEAAGFDLASLLEWGAL